MNVEVLYFDGCPNYEVLLPRVRALLARGRIEADVKLIRIETHEDADRLRFLGSPTVCVDGHDAELGAAQRHHFGLKCRIDQGPAGLRGEPPDEWIMAAIRNSPPG